MSFPSVLMHFEIFQKFSDFLAYLKETSIQHKPRSGQKLTTSCDEDFYSCYRFHFGCCKNPQKRHWVHVVLDLSKTVNVTRED